VTWALYGLFAIFGYFLYGFGPAVPLLREEEHTSAAVSGLHSTALATGSIVSGLLGTYVVARWGRPRAVWAALAGMCAGVVLFCSAPVLPVTLAGALVTGTFGSALVNINSAALSDHHGAAAPAAMSEANALGSGLGLVAPLVIGATVAAGAGWRVGLLVILPLCAALAVAAGRVRLPDHRAGPGAAEVRAPSRLSRSGRLSRRYWWAWSVLVACIAVEFCVTIWCSDVLRQRAGLSAGVAATGVSAVVGGITAGRLLGGRLALRYDLEWLLYRALALTLAGFTVFWLSTAGWLSFLGLLLAGLGMSLQFPLNISRAIGFSDGRPDLAMSRFSLGSGLAVGGGPFLLGALSDAVGTHRAFLLVPLLLAVAALGIRLGGRSGRSGRSAVTDVPAGPPTRPAG
jgi:predicted MFS family arabinose efflux permease